MQAIADGDMSNRVQFGLRIDDSAVADYQVDGFLGGLHRGRGEHAKRADHDQREAKSLIESR